MELQVVGAGLGRTGTLSLKAALERLLGGRCYHMVEVFGHPEHAPVWQAAAEGKAVDWDVVLADYNATVDWPACALWRELADANPNAVILLSTRDSAQTWWKSASQTIFVGMDNMEADPVPGWRAMWDPISARSMAPGFVTDAEIAMADYEAHNARVRAEADPARLLEWQPGDGWEPLCARLDVPVPDEPFPHLNTSEEWAKHRAQSES
jgi:Sulfotransferase domain